MTRRHIDLVPVSALCLAAMASGCVGTIAGSDGTGAGGHGLIPDPGLGGPVVLPPNLPGYDPAFACASPDVRVPATIARLPRIQFVNSVKELFSTLSAANLAAEMNKIADNLKLLPVDSAGSGYSVQDTTLSQQHVDAVFDVAATLAVDLAASDAYVQDLVSVCGAGSTRASLADASCKDAFVAHYAQKVLRRPAGAAELPAFKAAYDRGLDFFLGSLLLDPNFYYRFDSEGDVLSGAVGVDAVYRLTKYELLSKITFLFWNRPPDDGLLQFAADPALDLSGDAGVQAVLDRVLASPYAQEGVQLFFREWLRLDSTPSFKGVASPAFQTLATGAGQNFNLATVDQKQQMIDEALAMIGHYALTPDGRYDDLLTNQYSFATRPELAKIYGVPTWDGSESNLVPFPSSQPRSGLLTRAAFLAKDREYTDPVHKGLRIRERILCDTIAPPPADVAVKFAKTVVDVTRTTRDDLEAVINSEQRCAACHPLFTPLGYFSEDYDTLGRHRTEETRFVQDANGAATATIAGKVPVNTTGVPLLFDGDEEPIDGAIELADHIAKSGKGHHCLVRQYFRYARGRVEVDAGDGCSLEGMRLGLMADGGGLMAMWKTTVRTAGFRERQIQ